METILKQIATELSATEAQIAAAVQLLDEGSTVPFIARYRKEMTGGLDDTQLRTLEERLRYLRDLEERRGVVLHSIMEQGKLTPELEASIKAADTKVRLEDLYAPYKPKRRTKAQIAREAGLEPLADALLTDPSLSPEEKAAAFVDTEKGIADAAAALDGARQILMERFAEEADLIGLLREQLWESAHIRSQVVEGKEESGAKFSDYFKADELVGKVPSHRALALFRGRKEGVLRLSLSLGENEEEASLPYRQRIADFFGIQDQGRAADAWLLETVDWSWKARAFPHLEAELENRLREQAEEEAIRVFGRNLHDLLLAAPAGPRVTMGLDPGYRTGVKVAVVDATGKLLDTATIYPHEPKKQWEPSIEALAELSNKHQVEVVSIGNGTASRETDRLVADLMKQHPELKILKVVVSEAGASVYSASSLAAKEFPEVDVSLRGAISIARRLQDPLAELVKIEPRSIGVGQYQHDVSQSNLARTLDAVVEDCVNAVGVDVNTASAPLLTRVSGLDKRIAKQLVQFRDQNGPFANRTQLMQVPRLGEKTFQLSAGFLRIMNGDNPLDASAVHPEAYPVVEKIIEATGKDVKQLIGDTLVLRNLDPRTFINEQFGEPTVRDILSELEKPGRDPRPEFKTPSFKENVNELEDLQPGMLLEGVVTNVTNFGAFVDIGVHQDGLVHVSQLATRFVKDPRELVKPGQIVQIKVLEVDLTRRRISLTMKLEPPRPRVEKKERPKPQVKAKPKGKKKSGPNPQKPTRKPEPPRPQTAMAAAFAKIGLDKFRDR